MYPLCTNKKKDESHKNKKEHAETLRKLTKEGKRTEVMQYNNTSKRKHTVFTLFGQGKHDIHCQFLRFPPLFKRQTTISFTYNH